MYAIVRDVAHILIRFRGLCHVFYIMRRSNLSGTLTSQALYFANACANKRRKKIIKERECSVQGLLQQCMNNPASFRFFVIADGDASQEGVAKSDHGTYPQ